MSSIRLNFDPVLNVTTWHALASDATHIAYAKDVARKSVALYWPWLQDEAESFAMLQLVIAAQRYVEVGSEGKSSDYESFKHCIWQHVHFNVKQMASRFSRLKQASMGDGGINEIDPDDFDPMANVPDLYALPADLDMISDEDAAMARRKAQEIQAAMRDKLRGPEKTVVAALFGVDASGAGGVGSGPPKYERKPRRDRVKEIKERALGKLKDRLETPKDGKGLKGGLSGKPGYGAFG